MREIGTFSMTTQGASMEEARARAQAALEQACSDSGYWQDEVEVRFDPILQRHDGTVALWECSMRGTVGQ